MNSEKQGENLGPKERTGDSGASPQDLLARYDAEGERGVEFADSLSDEDADKLAHALGSRMLWERKRIQYPSKTRGSEDAALEVGKTYPTRDGLGLVKIVRAIDEGGYDFWGEWVRKPPYGGHLYQSSFTLAGRYWNDSRTDEWDLMIPPAAPAAPEASQPEGSA